MISAATVIAIVVIAVHQHTGQVPATPHLPSTAQQWVDQWTTASVEDPAGVCRKLFAPALERAFQTDTGRSCRRYYRSVKRNPFRIRRVLEDGGTAAVEAQQVAGGRQWGVFTIVLSRVRGGWQAIDVVAGGSVELVGGGRAGRRKRSHQARA